jgi:hypothetical protein
MIHEPLPYVAQYREEVIVANDSHAVDARSKQHSVTVEDHLRPIQERIDVGCRKTLSGINRRTQNNSWVPMRKHLVPDCYESPDQRIRLVDTTEVSGEGRRIRASSILRKAINEWVALEPSPEGRLVKEMKVGLNRAEEATKAQGTACLIVDSPQPEERDIAVCTDR